MNQSLTYLMDELCAGVEIYYTGRTGGQYLKTAFILCDDHSELVSKLFLLTDNPQWTDKKPNNQFKNYHDVMQDVQAVVTAKMAVYLQKVNDLQEAMTNRHKRRNDFFHSAGLLDLSVTSRNCVEAALPERPGDPKDAAIEGLGDPIVVRLLKALKATTIHTLRNRVVHKQVYRPTREEVQAALKESRSILLPLTRHLKLHDEINWYMNNP